MICCKIISNFQDKNISLAKILKSLGSLGYLIWDGQSIFFADVSSYQIDESKIRSLLRKCGVKSLYINVYDKDNQPRENDEIDAWILDKLIKINYKLCEDQSQEAFRNISIGLDILEAEMKRIESSNLEKEQKNQTDEKEVECIEQT